MPNHISNVLRLYASDKEQMDTIIKEITRGENLFDFNVFIPYPSQYQVDDDAHESYLKENPGDYANAPKDGYNKGGYEWCRDNWGTKWNSYDHNVRRENTYGAYAIYFETAWAWPRPIIEAFLKKYPDLDVNYVAVDEGGWFAVHLKREEGVTKLIEWGDKGNDEVIDAIWEAMRD